MRHKKRKRAAITDDKDERALLPAAKRRRGRARKVVLWRLANELLDRICGYLDWKSLSMLRVTCKHFKEVVQAWVAVQRSKAPLVSLALIPRTSDFEELYWTHLPRTLYVIREFMTGRKEVVEQKRLLRAVLCFRDPENSDHCCRLSWDSQPLSANLPKVHELVYEDGIKIVQNCSPSRKLKVSRKSSWPVEPCFQLDCQVEITRGHRHNRDYTVVATNDLTAFIRLETIDTPFRRHYALNTLARHLSGSLE